MRSKYAMSIDIRKELHEHEKQVRKQTRKGEEGKVHAAGYFNC